MEVSVEGFVRGTPLTQEASIMSRRASLVALMASLTLVGLGYLSAFIPAVPPMWGAWALLVGSVAALLAMSLLGAGESPEARRLLLPLGIVFILLVGGIGSGLLLPDAGAGDRLFGGLPLPAALLLYGAGLLPLLVVPLVYAWTFQGTGLEQEAMADLTARAKAAMTEAATTEAATEPGARRETPQEAAERGAGGRERPPPGGASS